MLKCREVEANSSQWLDGDLPWRTRLSMRLHWLICVHCRRFVSHLRQVRDMMRRRGRDRLSDDELEQVKRRLADASVEQSTKSV